MSKKEVLVHECGHIVQPGDMLVVEHTLELDEDRACTRMGEEVEFVRIIEGGMDSVARFVMVAQIGRGPSLCRNVVRFNCTVMEVGDE